MQQHIASIIDSSSELDTRSSSSDVSSRLLSSNVMVSMRVVYDTELRIYCYCKRPSGRRDKHYVKSLNSIKKMTVVHKFVF